VTTQLLILPEPTIGLEPMTCRLRSEGSARHPPSPTDNYLKRYVSRPPTEPIVLGTIRSRPRTIPDTADALTRAPGARPLALASRTGGVAYCPMPIVVPGCRTYAARDRSLRGLRPPDGPPAAARLLPAVPRRVLARATRPGSGRHARPAPRRQRRPPATGRRARALGRAAQAPPLADGVAPHPPRAVGADSWITSTA
jgi:hypothetical protein